MPEQYATLVQRAARSDRVAADGIQRAGCAGCDFQPARALLVLDAERHDFFVVAGQPVRVVARAAANVDTRHVPQIERLARSRQQNAVSTAPGPADLGRTTAVF